MSGKQYLILSPDGSRSLIALVDREGLEKHLAEAVDPEAAWQPRWLEAIRTERNGRTVYPGGWDEVEELILEVKVVVPQPVTVKWQIP